MFTFHVRNSPYNIDKIIKNYSLLSLNILIDIFIMLFKNSAQPSVLIEPPHNRCTVEIIYFSEFRSPPTILYSFLYFQVYTSLSLYEEPLYLNISYYTSLYWIAGNLVSQSFFQELQKQSVTIIFTHFPFLLRSSRNVTIITS